MTYFLNFGTLSLTFERVKIDTSFFFFVGYATASSIRWVMNDPIRGRGQGHVTYFLNFGTPSVTFERVIIDTSFFSLLDTHVKDFVFLCRVFSNFTYRYKAEMCYSDIIKSFHWQFMLLMYRDI